MASGPSQEHETSPTRTHSRGAPIWLGDDQVVQLREWATEKVHPLPESDGAELVVGSEATVDLRLVDPTGSVSRRHALLRREEGTWRIEDLHSKNGIRIDGGRAPSRRLRIVPGVEIGIGDLTLVAEN